MSWLVQMLNVDVLWISGDILNLLKTLANNFFLLNSFSWALDLQITAKEVGILSFFIGQEINILRRIKKEGTVIIDGCSGLNLSH